MSSGDPFLQMLRSSAERSPDALALLSPSSRVTYGDLARESDRIASAILASGTDLSKPVFLLLDEPTSVFCALFGVRKAGGYASVLDPQSPRERIDKLVSIAGAKTSIVDSKFYGKIDLTRISYEDSPANQNDLPEVPWDPDAPGILTFTSGSTGNPKGWVFCRGELSTYVRPAIGSPGHTGREGVFGSPAFARGIVGVLKPLLQGSAVALFRTADHSLARAADWIVESEVSTLHVPSSFLRQLMRATDDRFENIRVVRLGGERVTRADVELVRRRFPPGTIVRISYASTEAGRITQRSIESGEVLEDDPLGVGRPHPGIFVSIESDDGRMLDSGECGEIVVSSRWRRTLLGEDGASGVVTPDPDRGGHWRIRTGDLGFVRPDGSLVVLGRRDHQLKIRGNRVEPAEVETAILETPGVDDVVVMGLPDHSGNLNLTAFIGAASGIDETELRKKLRLKLPSYMAPSSIHVLPSLPTMPSGKPDRTALAALARERDNRAPSFSGRVEDNEIGQDEGTSGSPLLEKKIAAAWSAVLERPIGEDDDFFAIGGNSLQAAHIFGELEQIMGRELPLSLLMEASTVVGLAKRLRDLPGSDGTDFSAVVHLGGSGDGIPIFFFSGSGGELLFLKDVVAALPADQLFYGVRGLGLDGGPIPPQSYPAIAAQLVGEIRRVYPGGPCVLAGHSSGGSLALEVGHQLRDLEGEAPLVIAVDTPGWTSNRPILLRAFHQALNLVRNPRRVVPYLRTLHFNIRIRLGLTRRPSRVLDDNDQDRYSQIKSIYLRASSGYNPEPYPGDVTLVRASDGMFRHAVSGHLGWEHVVTGKFEVIAMPGDHVSVIGDYPEEFARMLVEQVRPIAMTTNESLSSSNEGVAIDN